MTMTNVEKKPEVTVKYKPDGSIQKTTTLKEQVKPTPTNNMTNDNNIIKMISQDKEAWSFLFAGAEKIMRADPQHFDSIIEVMAAALDFYLGKPVESKTKIIEMPSNKEEKYNTLLTLAQDILKLKHNAKISPYEYIERLLHKKRYKIGERLTPHDEIKTFNLKEYDDE